MTAATRKRIAYRSTRGAKILENQGITVRPLGTAVTFSGNFTSFGPLCVGVTDIPDFSLSAREALLFVGRIVEAPRSPSYAITERAHGFHRDAHHRAYAR